MQHTRESLRKEVRELADLGIPAVVLFGVPAHKDATGSGAWDPDGIVQVALRDLRDEMGDRIVLIADLCLDEYTDHGHCGVLTADGTVDNDATIELYATRRGRAGRGGRRRRRAERDDGRPGRRDPRRARRRGSSRARRSSPTPRSTRPRCTGRSATRSTCTIVGGGDRKGYQQDWHNGREALEEVRLDLAEGADIVMVKPALAYLDVIAAVRAEVDVPVAAYHVSGEYAMIKAAAANGWIDGAAVALEHVTAIKRAGADIILTYLARELAESL